jgi:hypothetical protein
MGNTGHSGVKTTGIATGVIRESPHVPCTNLPLQQHEILAQPPATLIEVQPEDRRSTTYSSPAGTNYNHHPKHATTPSTDPSKTLLYGQEGQTKVNLGRPIGGLEEDPAGPNAVHHPSNYQTKVTDPTRAGAEEVEVTPILASFGKMSVYDEAMEDRSSPRQRLLDQNLPLHHQTQHDQFSSSISPITTGAGAGAGVGLGTGSHNQFSPEPRSPKRHDHYSNMPFTGTGSHEQFSPEPRSPKRHDHYSNLPFTGTGTHNLFSSPEANQNLHVHHRDHDSEPILPVTGTPPSDDHIHRTEGEYSDLPTLQEGRNKLYDTPLSGGGIGTFEPEKALPRESSVPLEYTRQMPEDVDRASDGSSYTEKVSSASSALVDKAVLAKNAVASKLGYGGEGEEANKPITTSATEYGKKIVDKLNPVYEKVAGAGSAVMSKIPGTGSGGTEGEEGQDKGVSVREYISEKLRPGEEDRALSEVISETLYRRKEETGKREEEPMGAEELEKVAERVTESEEVKRRLGTGEERAGQKVAESYVNSPGSSVVDKLRGAVGGWFGVADPIQNQQSSPGNEGTYSTSDRENHGTRAGE